MYIKSLIARGEIYPFQDAAKRGGSRADLEPSTWRAHAYSSLSVFIDTCSVYSVLLLYGNKVHHENVCGAVHFHEILIIILYFFVEKRILSPYSEECDYIRCVVGTKNIFLYSFLLFFFCNSRCWFLCSRSNECARQIKFSSSAH